MMRLPLLMVGTLGLAACGGEVREVDFDRAFFDDALTSCMFDTSPPGAYAARERVLGPNGLPLVTPTVDDAGVPGTPAAAAELNTCIEQRFAAANLLPATTAAGTAPQPQSTSALPFPTGYPVQPGDRELWASLTPAEQQRALGFLKIGSTIRSSLLGD